MSFIIHRSGLHRYLVWHEFRLQAAFQAEFSPYSANKIYQRYIFLLYLSIYLCLFDWKSGAFLHSETQFVCVWGHSLQCVTHFTVPAPNSQRLSSRELFSHNMCNLTINCLKPNKTSEVQNVGHTHIHTHTSKHTPRPVICLPLAILNYKEQLKIHFTTGRQHLIHHWHEIHYQEIRWLVSLPFPLTMLIKYHEQLTFCVRRTMRKEIVFVLHVRPHLVS